MSGSALPCPSRGNVTCNVSGLGRSGNWRRANQEVRTSAIRAANARAGASLRRGDGAAWVMSRATSSTLRRGSAEHGENGGGAAGPARGEKASGRNDVQGGEG